MNMRISSQIALLCVVLFFAGCVGEEEPDLADVGNSDTEEFDDGDGDDSDGGGDIEEELDPYADLPARPWPAMEPGPLGVGYRTAEVTYNARGEEEPRTLSLSIWYPTRETDGETARYEGAIERPGIWKDAEPAFSGPAPVMLFSHGHQSVSWQSYYWTEYLASHGWIVAAPDHLYGTFFDLPSDNQLKSALFRGEDISATLDFLKDLPESDPLAAWVSDRVAASGHSFGGFTMFAVAGARFDVDGALDGCAAGTITGRTCMVLNEETAPIFREGFFDERILAVIPKTSPGGDLFANGLDELETPVLFWTAGRDATLPNEVDGDPIWEGLSAGEHRRIDVINAGHFSYSNMCDAFGRLSMARDDGCGSDFVDPEELHPLVNAYSLNFLRHHLGLEETEAYFDEDAQPLDPEFVYYFK